MRNLLGRLHARSAEELARIATFWQVPLPSGDRHGHVGALYRALTNPRAVRSAWDCLDPDEQTIVRHLALETNDAPSLAELAHRLNRPEADTRQTAVKLYRVGILARERDDDPLPVGEAPRLFLPRELALLFRRVQDEIEAGDLSSTPLRALVELLDDAEIEDAAQTWGMTVIPGLRQRADLTKSLLRQVANPARVTAVAAKRRRDAAVIWRYLWDAPGGTPVALSAAAEAASLTGDDPRLGHRLRVALAELETALLVWHTYHADGSRWLFIPNEIRNPDTRSAIALPPLPIVAETTVESPAWRHPHALAWDLLTVVRALTATDAPIWTTSSELPRGWLRRLNRGLWHRGADSPSPAYLDLMVRLARSEGLLDRPDDLDTRFSLGSAFRLWRDRSFAEQTDRLHWWWLDLSDWPEGSAAEVVEVWGADWRGARRRLIALLTDPDLALQTELWYPLDSVAERIAARDPDLLGPTFTAATARETAGDGRAAAIAEIVSVELSTAFVWFGYTHTADIPGHASAVRIDSSGPASTRTTDLPVEPASDSRPALTLNADGRITLRTPTPVRVWSLSAFADLEQLSQVSSYRLSEAALNRALAAGFNLDQVIAFLEAQSGTSLPTPWLDQLTNWSRQYKRIRVRPAVILAPDDTTILGDLTHLLTENGYVTREFEPAAILVEMPASRAGDTRNAVDVLMTLLRAHGHAALLATSARPTRSRDHDPESR